MPQGAAWGRPERTTAPQEAWRRTQIKLSGRVGISASRLFREQMEKRRGHDVPVYRNESKRVDTGARQWDVRRLKVRETPCSGMEGGSAIAAT